MAKKPNPRKKTIPRHEVVFGIDPYSETLWEKVEKYRKGLRNSTLHPTDQALQKQWATVSHQSAASRSEPVLPLGETPLSAVFKYIQAGSYPPPELLLALRDGWYEYLNAWGDISLEQALIGKVGTGAKSGERYSQRLSWTLDQAALTICYAMLLRAGCTVEKSCKLIAESREGHTGGWEKYKNEYFKGFRDWVDPQPGKTPTEKEINEALSWIK